MVLFSFFGIATRYGLDGPGWNSDGGGWGPRFSLPVQTCPEAHSASCTIGTGCLSRWIKRPGLGVNHPPPSSTDVKERVEFYLYSPSGPSWPVTERDLLLPNHDSAFPPHSSTAISPPCATVPIRQCTTTYRVILSLEAPNYCL